MDKRFARMEKIYGKNTIESLHEKHVAIFGIGGVGSFAAEAVARAGIGNITLVDGDVVDITNINRQLIALASTVGKYKAEVMGERIKDINPLCHVRVVKSFIDPDSALSFFTEKYDYVIDAIDSVKSKIALIKTAYENNIPIISSMGMGNKVDPSKLKVEDIHKTSVCPLAKIIRKEMKKAGVERLKVVYSTEIPIQSREAEYETEAEASISLYKKKSPPGSVSFMPSSAGLMLAGEVINHLAKI